MGWRGRVVIRRPPRLISRNSRGFSSFEIRKSVKSNDFPWLEKAARAAVAREDPFSRSVRLLLYGIDETISVPLLLSEIGNLQ